MNRFVQTVLFTLIIPFSLQSLALADMFLKDRSDEMCETTGSPLLCGSIREANKAKLQEMIREEVKRQLDERARYGENSYDTSAAEEQLQRNIKAAQERWEHEDYSRCVQNAGVRAHLDCK